MIKSDEQVIIGYMDMIDWQYELGNASGGNKIYPSVRDLKRHSQCWQQCGIVKVEVRIIEEVEPQNLREEAE